MTTQNEGTLLHWMVNEKIRQNQIDFSRAKVIIVFVLILGVLSIIMSAWQFSLGFPIRAIPILMAGILSFSVAFILRWVTSFVVPGIILTSILYTVVTFMLIISSGVLNFTVAWYGMICILAYIVIGTRGGLFFGALSIATLFVVFWFEKSIVLTLGDITYPIDSLMINSINILGSAGLLFAYSRMNQKFQNQLQSTVEKIGKDEEQKVQTLDDTSEVLTSLAQGDLTKRITSDFTGFEQLKSTINNTMTMLEQIVSKIIVISEHVTKGARELSQGSQNLANGTAQQAASLEEISSSMSEIGAQAKINNEKSIQAQALSTQTTKGVTDGNQQMQLMTKSMETISNTSSEVSKVIKVIDEIAFQTNLLALNAAVEAARAGKYGKGFAVVAEEVRNLASRSANAAKDTTQLIENSIKEVASGVENASKTAEVLGGIMGDIEKVNDFIGEIAAASQEQVSGVNEVNTSLTNVNNVIQQNSSISEESASASTELSAQATELQKMVRIFKLTDQVIEPRQVVAADKPIKKPEISPIPQIEKKEVTQIAERKTIMLDDEDFGKYGN